MKFFHLSDLHTGLKLINRDMGEDQKYIFGKIAEKAAEEKPDAIVIAGDIYDKAVPSADAVELFDYFMSRLNAAVPEAEIMIISGNHDSPARLNTFRKILSRQKIHMIGLPPEKPEDHIEKVTMRDEYGNVNFYLLPFVKPSMIRNITGTDEKGNILSYDEALHRLIQREDINEKERNVLVSHQFYLPEGKNPDDVERMDSEIKTVGNIDAVKSDILERFDYGALGHIHKPSKVGSEYYRYCGTPIPVSVSEAGQKKGIVVVEMKEKGNTEVRVIPLEPLRQIRKITGLLEDVLLNKSDDYVTVTLTDKDDLDITDMNDRLRSAFPNLLEIRREGIRTADYMSDAAPADIPDAYELCRKFLGDITPEEEEILKDAVNTAMEG